MADLHRFWDGYRWPIDTPDWVFLGRAVHQIGESLFGKTWDGAEPAAWAYLSRDSLRPCPPAPDHAMRAEICEADRILRELHPELDASRPPIPRDFRRIRFYPEITFTAWEWETARAQIERQRGVDRDRVQRFLRVTDTVRDAAVARRLLTGVRPLLGGDAKPMPAEWWNTERVRQRFIKGQIDPSDPFSSGRHYARYSYIFVGSDSLNKFLKMLNRPASSGRRREQATRYIIQQMSKPKPKGMTQAKLKAECMEATGVNENGGRAR